MGASKKMVGVSTLPFLPPEILFEILAKLPAKSLARFKCVSKFFNSLTCDPLFAYRHRSLSLTLPSRASILISINRPELGLEFYTINFSEENQGKLQANPIRFSHGEIFRKGRLGSSSDGLMICQSKSKGDITICNISMRQRISLPRIQFQLDSSSTCARLGFDSFTKRYKVLMSAKIHHVPYSIKKYKHWVFTLGIDEYWREINSPQLSQFYPFDISPSFYHPNSSVYINGVIYSYNSLTDEIGAFEVGADNLSTIPFPDEVLEQYYYIDGKKYHFSYFFLKKFALVEVDGRLAMVLFRRTREDMFSMDVWTWEEAKEWKKLTIRIPLEGSQIINKDCLSRFTTNHAGEIMILCIHSEHFSILVCNFKSKIWRKFDVGGVEDFPIPCYWEVNMFNIIDNVFSLK